MAGFNPQKSSVTHYEPGEAIRRPSFKKRQPTGANMKPLPSQVGVTKGKNVHGTVSREDQFSEASVGEMAQVIGESVSPIDSHLVQIAIETEDQQVFDDVMNIL